jgi:alkylation response protein AidB-like acyl-CoA dehydrogenase
MTQHPAAPELALHSKVVGSETGVEVLNALVKMVGVTAYDERYPIVEYLHESLAYPVIEGSNIGVRRRQLQDLLREPGYDPLAASGMS